jgi:predicted Zn-dependent protease
MIGRAWRLALVVVVTLAILASCSSAMTQERRPASPVLQPSGATADTCVAPVGVTLQDQDPSDHQVPWKRNGATKVVITFETKNVTPDWVAEMQKGVAAWNRSPCLDTKLVQTCQPNRNCITVSVAPESTVGADGNFDAVESGGFTVGGHIEYSSSLTGGAKTNVAIHEMGHAVGLAHRETEDVLMNGDTYDDVFDPDPIDYQNLLVLYGNQE